MGIEQQVREAQKKISHYAFSFDFMARITRLDTEKDVIKSILEFISILFSPQELQYISIQEEGVYQILSLSDHHEPKFTNQIEKIDSPYTWTESGKGFRIRIQSHNIDLGIVEIDKVKFPKNITHYLHLSLSIASVCGMAIENARRKEELIEAKEQLSQEKEKLEKALTTVKKLSGLLPICSYCKKIRNDNGYWQQIEQYIHEHSYGVQFTHSICHDCLKKEFPDIKL